MPTYRQPKQPDPVEINNFLGLNEAYGDTEVKPGEAIYMRNFNITNNFKLRKRKGFTQFINTGTTSPIRGLWYGTIGGKRVLISCSGGKVFEYNYTTLANTEIGTLTDAQTSIFYFEEKLYFLNGTDYKQYDGITFEDVDPYIPTIAINAPPDGGGTLFEEINLLTGFKNQTFVGDGSKTIYVLAEDNLASDLVKVWIDGVRRYETTHFSVNRLTGKVTFLTAPALDTEVKIEWNKEEATALLHDGETKWVEYLDGATNTTQNSTYKATGTYSCGIVTGTGAAAGAILATQAIPSTDLETYNYIRLWVRTTIAISAGQLQLLLDDTIACASPLHTLDLPAISSGGSGTYINLPLVDGKTGIISIGIKQTVDLGAFTIYVDDVRALNLNGNALNKEMVTKNKYHMFYGAGNDTNVFLWGNPDHKNRMLYSGTMKANYFPANGFTDVGSDEFAITDIVSQYSKQVIFKEDRTYFSYPEYNETLNVYIYPINDLNEAIGNVNYGGVQIIKNNPVSIHGGAVWDWQNTDIEDERNVEPISTNIEKSLKLLDLSTAITFDFQKEREYWLNVGSLVYIFNYNLGVWYVYDNIAATCFEYGDKLYFGKADGTIQAFSGALNDNGTAITAKIKSGFADFGAYEYRKNSRNMWLTLQPFTNTSISVKCPTNRVIETAPALKTFTVDASSATNTNPQTYHLKINAKKYTSIQFIFSNAATDEEVILLSFKVDVSAGNTI